MTELLERHFDAAFEGPEGVKKLRELILLLGMQGKLVPQDIAGMSVGKLQSQGNIAGENLQLKQLSKHETSNKLPSGVSGRQSDVLPSGWISATLGDVLTFEYGHNLPADKRSNTGEFPVYGSNGIVGTHDSASVLAPCIIIGRKGSAGAINLCLTPGCCVTDVAYYCMPPKTLDLYYTFWLLRSLGLEYLGKGIKPGLTRNEAYALRVSIPPLSEQRSIVAKINELMVRCDELEQLRDERTVRHTRVNTAAIHKLLTAYDVVEYTRARKFLGDHFEELYTARESVAGLRRAIQEVALMGRISSTQPDDESANEFVKLITSEKRQGQKTQMKNSSALEQIKSDEVPFDLPRGWAWVRLGMIAEIKGGKRVSNGYKLLQTSTPYIYIRVTDMKNGTIDDSDLRYIDAEMRERIKNYVITKDDLYMTIVGATIGKCGIVPDRFDGMNLTENAARIIVSSHVDKSFLYRCLASGLCQRQFVEKTKQVGVQKMALNRLASTLIPLPPLLEQRRIVARIGHLISACFTLEQQIDAASRIQTSLLNAVMAHYVSQPCA